MEQIKKWNRTNVSYSSDSRIHDKLEKTASIYPNRVALTTRDADITYSELNNTSNRLAHKLISMGVEIEDFVLVHLNRSIGLMMSIFGILKAGGVYVPVHRDIPVARIASIIDDTNPKVIITSREFAQKNDPRFKILIIEDFLGENDPKTFINPTVPVQSNNLAYAIFTSGTTGKPKGVLIEHHSVLNRIEWMQKTYAINEHDVLIQKTPISFDVSIWELFWWSFVGAKLVIPELDVEKNPEKITTIICEKNVSIIHFVPSMFSVYIKYLNMISPENKVKSLRWVFCSGEELYQNQVEGFYDTCKLLQNTSQLVNLYGPTEATVDVSYFNCSSNTTAPVPIGKPIDNTQIYIIDEYDNILPPNECGEIVLCGVNLARGYLNRPELNEEKFFQLNVFGNSTRAYRTGDIGYYDATGEIIYNGRNDSQVKLRGFRIELSEIENTILSHPQIHACVCVVKNIHLENVFIAAYLVTENDEPIDSETLKQYVKEKLPEYMIPSQFIRLEHGIPTSTSGKADRKLLTERVDEPQAQLKQTNNTCDEKKLTAIWSVLLRNKNINTNINFFDLGGNSLLLIQMTFLIKKEFGKDVDVISLMSYPTIKSLSEYISQL